MRKFATYPFILVLAVVGLLNTSFMEPEPAGASEEALLFRIERSRDADEIWYSVNLYPDGSVDPEMPVRVFWVKKSEDNKVEPLTRIQERFSYGIQSIDPDPAAGDQWIFKLAAYKNRDFLLKKAAGNRYSVCTMSHGSEVEVKKLFVQFDGGTFLAPSVAFVQLSGTDRRTGAEIQEIITGSYKQ
ncbi:MAG: DUF4833 domain-containing protein [Bacteroidales bacterium]|nr:DUF4833 domain-containing protein [Bacteroidales bacterium]MDT8430123.1 DUF4833 domain-containing protein [Bacteroidales bacterium]